MSQQKQTTNSLNRPANEFTGLWQDPGMQHRFDSHSAAAQGIARPAARLESIRTWLRSRIRQQLSAPEQFKLLRWREIIHDACAQNLSEELEQTRQVFCEQQSTWSRYLHRASFGTPGLFTRITALLLWFKCRSHLQKLDAARLRLDSMRNNNQIVFESCEGLAAVAECLCGDIKALAGADAATQSRSTAKDKRIERFIKLEQERLITQELINRGQVLKSEQASLGNQTQLVREQTYRALRYVTSEPIRQLRLRQNFESKNGIQSSKAFERLLHSGFVFCAAVAEQEFAAASSRLEILQSEYKAIRKLMQVRMEKLGTFADLSKQTIQTQLFQKGHEVEEKYIGANRDYQKQI
jgi:hypothetical protein